MITTSRDADSRVRHHANVNPMNDVPDPFAQLERSHRRLEDRLDDLVQVSASAPDGALSADAAELVREVAGFFARAVRRHEEDEESSLFPRVRERADDAVKAILTKLAEEHREHEELHRRLEAIGSAAGEADAGAGARELASVTDALVRAYRAHVEEEEKVLFPAARALFADDPGQLAAIADEMAARRGRAGGTGGAGGGGGGGRGGAGGGGGGRGGGGGGGGGGGRGS
jgi:hemerythrin-like domain-containing protein